MRRWVGLLLLFFLCLPSLAEATIINAASCSYADVDSAVNSTPAVDGDTVHIPGGTCTWTSLLTITNKSITIEGVAAIPVATTIAEAQAMETVCNTGGQTTYTCVKGTIQMINWTTKATGNTPAGFSQLRNLVIWTPDGAGTGCNSYGTGAVHISGLSQQVRITGFGLIYGTGCWGLVARDVFGVLDHFTILAHNGLRHGLVVRHSGYGGVGLYGDNSWAVASSMGGAENFFAEDGTYAYDGASNLSAPMDHFYGGRAVMRFSRFLNGSVQSHGLESGGRPRSVRHMEVYRNIFTWTLTETAALISTRGGTGRFFDNTLTGSMTQIADFNTDRAGPGHPLASYWPWGFCQKVTPSSLTRSGSTATITTSVAHGYQGGADAGYVTVSGATQSEYNGTFVVTGVNTTQLTYTVTGSPATPATGTITVANAFDGNTDAAGYRCMDQTGAGAGNLISGDIPTITNVGDIAQALDPLLCFNNTDDGAVGPCTENNGSDAMTANRDYFNQDASCSGASCTTGIGRGTTLPTGCTPQPSGRGPYFWKTDAGSWNTSTTETFSDTPGEDGVLYECTETDTFTESYVPYTYPHPLTLTVSSTPVSGVGNLRFTGAVRF